MNNYTQVPNKLLELIMSGVLNKTEIRILSYIARKTYGYQKKQDAISHSQLVNKLGLSKSTVSETLSRLKQFGITEQLKSGKSKKEPSIWKINLKNIQKKTVRYSQTVRYSRTKLFGITGNTKENITKENKEEKKIIFSKPEDQKLYDSLDRPTKREVDAGRVLIVNGDLEVNWKALT